MARDKQIDTNPKLLPVDVARQCLPGTFEHALNHLLDGPIDLSSFDARFRNDETGAPAYPPALLLKVVLFAYSQGIASGRGIEQACREHVTSSRSAILGLLATSAMARNRGRGKVGPVACAAPRCHAKKTMPIVPSTVRFSPLSSSR